MKASVIIPTFNREKILRICIKRLLNQETKYDFEILIVDDGSEKKVEINNKKVTIMRTNNQGPAAARNLAMRKAKGEILIFINDDTLVKKDFLERHLNFHKNNNDMRAGLIGPFVEHPRLTKNKIIKWLVNESRMHFEYKDGLENSVPWYYFWTCNLSVKKDFFEKNKLFFDRDFSVAAWEDIEMGHRAKEMGLKLYFDKELRAFHWHKMNMDELLARFFSHGRGLYCLKEKVPKKYLPPLAKKEYRVLARLLLAISMYPVTKVLVEKVINKEEKVNRWLMHYLIIGKKIEGFDHEKKRQERK